MKNFKEIFKEIWKKLGNHPISIELSSNDRFKSLPDDMIKIIFLYVLFNEPKQNLGINKRLYAISKDQTIWKELYSTLIASSIIFDNNDWYTNFHIDWNTYQNLKNNNQSPLGAFIALGYDKLFENFLKKNPSLNIDTIDFNLSSNFKLNKKATLLHLAAFTSNKKIVELLLEKNPNIIKFNKNIWELTPLHIASYQGHQEIVEVLLKEYNEKSDAFSLTILKRKEDTLKLSNFYKGRTVEIKPINGGGTPLHLAVQQGHTSLVKYFLQYIKNNLKEDSVIKIIDQPNINGWTPLHFAASRGHFNLLKLLIEEGANAFALTPSKNNILHLSCDNNFTDLSIYLAKKYESLPSQKNSTGWLPFHYACSTKNKHLISYFNQNYPLLNHSNETDDSNDSDSDDSSKKFDHMSIKIIKETYPRAKRSFNTCTCGVLFFIATISLLLFFITDLKKTKFNFANPLFLATMGSFFCLVLCCFFCLYDDKKLNKEVSQFIDSVDGAELGENTSLLSGTRQEKYSKFFIASEEESSNEKHDDQSDEEIKILIRT